MLDIHTHYDVEVLVGPSLAESLRHGVTTVMLGSCSLSTVHVDGVDAGDIFGRVEAIPREHVIGAVDEHKTWTNCEEYVAGARGAPARAQPGGVHRALRHARRDDGPGPRDAQGASDRPRSEQAQMERMLAEALRGRLRRNVLAATAFRQARRRGLPVAHPAVDLCQAARTAPAEVAAAACGPGPAVRARHREPAQPRLAAGPVARRLPQPAQDQPAVGRRRQVQPVRDPDDGTRRAAGQPSRRQLPLAAPAGAVRGLRRRHRPGDLRGVRCRRGGTAPARRGRAQRADARRGVPPPVPQGLREQVRRAGVAPRLLRRRDRRLPRRVGDRQVVRRGRPGPRRAAPRRRVPGPGARARHGVALAHHDLQPPARGAQEAGTRARHPDGLLRRGRAPAQHGVLQHGPAAAAACPGRARRRASRS